MQSQLQREYHQSKQGKGTSHETALASAMGGERLEEIGLHLSDMFTGYEASMNDWRKRMERYERRMEDDFSDRLSGRDSRDADQAMSSDIFNLQNDSLNVVGGFADFAFAQAKNDLFGTSPFYAANPEGIEDAALAEKITKHSHWKSSGTNMKKGLVESLQLSVFLGTGFPKVTWIRRLEEYEKLETVLVDTATNKPVITAAGDYVYLDDPLGDEDVKPDGMIDKVVNTVTKTRKRVFPEKDPDMDLSQGKYAYQDRLIKEVQTVFDNGDFHNISYKDISFDTTASDLCLMHTAVFHKFRIPLLDAKSDYNLTDEQYDELLAQVNSSANEGGDEAEQSRGENKPLVLARGDDEIQNPLVRVVEGYARIDALGNGKPIRVFVVFIPEIQKILTIDYLANVTPDGALPVFAIPTYRVPGRIYGRGFLWKFEKVQDHIDQNFNTVIWHNRGNSDPFTGVDKSALEDPDSFDEDEGLKPGIENVIELAQDKKITDFLSFMEMPDLDSRTLELMNLMIEVVQLRTGISSASQGEMSSLPQANTATGVKSLMSRAAILLKWVIDDLKDHVTPVLKYWVTLLYANHSHEETFRWGEGEAAQLLSLSPDEVRGLKYDVKVSMAQSQAQEKLESSNAAINIHTTYMQLPEHEKDAARDLYIKALKALGFDDAESIIRRGAVDLEGLLEILPPDLQQLILKAVQMNQDEQLPQTAGYEGEQTSE